MDHRIQEMENYATFHHIPIMEPDGITFLLTYIREHQIKNILEIGTAIGYSAIRMCLLNEEITVTTIERDPIRYQEAIKNIKLFQLENRITVLWEDAFDVKLENTYDLLFIDAAKSQYIKFFEKFEKNLTKNGVVISDNLNFHGLTKVDETTLSRNVRGIVRKLNLYIDYLKENKNYETTFYNIGDGIGVSVRKEIA